MVTPTPAAGLKTAVISFLSMLIGLLNATPAGTSHPSKLQSLSPSPTNVVSAPTVKGQYTLYEDDQIRFQYPAQWTIVKDKNLRSDEGYKHSYQTTEEVGPQTPLFTIYIESKYSAFHPKGLTFNDFIDPMEPPTSTTVDHHKALHFHKPPNKYRTGSESMVIEVPEKSEYVELNLIPGSPTVFTQRVNEAFDPIVASFHIK